MIIWTSDVVMAADFNSAGAQVNVRSITGVQRYEIIWEKEQREPTKIAAMGLRGRQKHRQEAFWEKVLEENFP